MRRDCVGSRYVFIKRHVSAKYADTREAGRNEVMAEIAKVITHQFVRSLALGVEGKEC